MGNVLEHRKELRVPETTEEFTYLVKNGLIERPQSWDSITKRGDIILDIGEKMNVPLVFLT